MLRINVGFQRKKGEAHYGSRGASANLELEFESTLIDDPARLKERMRQLFLLSKKSVEEELADSYEPPRADVASTPDGSAIRGEEEQEAPPARHRDRTRSATANQIRALYAIAERRGLPLAERLRTTFGVVDPAELSITEASRLIEELKATQT
ncbi:MAG: hypothetical protein K8U03_18210 [Planctomycetia bacterium]|nr:hypothetical protein [Planctomycetia bacterium]